MFSSIDAPLNFSENSWILHRNLAFHWDLIKLRGINAQEQGFHRVQNENLSQSSSQSARDHTKMMVKRDFVKKSTRIYPSSISAALIFRKANLFLWGSWVKLFKGIQAFDFTLSEMIVHWMCVRVLGGEKSSSELEESRLSIRFCLEIEKNWVKFKGKDSLFWRSVRLK